MLEVRIEILRLLDSGKSQHQVSRDLNISRKSTSYTLQNREKYETARRNNIYSGISRIGSESPVNILLWRWFCIARQRGIPISGPILQAKALKFHKELDIQNNFCASQGWLDHFKRMRNIKLYAISGESQDVDVDVVQDWFSSLHNITNGYQAEDIYNMDETSIFYRMLPTKTLASKSSTKKGGKPAKDLLTLVLAC